MKRQGVLLGAISAVSIIFLFFDLLKGWEVLAFVVMCWVLINFCLSFVKYVGEQKKFEIEESSETNPDRSGF